MDNKVLSPLEEEIGKAIVNAAFLVHKELGPGLLEKVYEVCIAHELRKLGYDVKRHHFGNPTDYLALLKGLVLLGVALVAFKKSQTSPSL
jgi:hypothetical protein